MNKQYKIGDIIVFQGRDDYSPYRSLSDPFKVLKNFDYETEIKNYAKYLINFNPLIKDLDNREYYYKRSEKDRLMCKMARLPFEKYLERYKFLSRIKTILVEQFTEEDEIWKIQNE